MENVHPQPIILDKALTSHNLFPPFHQISIVYSEIISRK